MPASTHDGAWSTSCFRRLVAPSTHVTPTLAHRELGSHAHMQPPCRACWARRLASSSHQRSSSSESGESGGAGGNGVTGTELLCRRYSSPWLQARCAVRRAKAVMRLRGGRSNANGGRGGGMLGGGCEDGGGEGGGGDARDERSGGRELGAAASNGGGRRGYKKAFPQSRGRFGGGVRRSRVPHLV